MKVAVAGIPGAWSTEMLRRALERIEVDSFAFSLADCLFDLNDGRVLLDDFDLGTLDAVIVKKLGGTTDPLTPPRVHLLRQLEARGVRVFSPAEAIADVADRYRMTQRLGQAGLPMPPTVVVEDVDTAAQIVEQWGQVIVKPVYTSKGKGMQLLASDAVHRLTLRRWRRKWEMPFYIQAFVPNRGRDVGVAVLGGEVIGAFSRVASSASWLTTTSAGGHYEPCELNSELVELADRVAEVFGLDYTVVDMVETPSGYLVYEASAFGGFSGLWQTRGIDVARRYVEYVVGVVQR